MWTDLNFKMEGLSGEGEKKECFVKSIKSVHLYSACLHADLRTLQGRDALVSLLIDEENKAQRGDVT